MSANFQYPATSQSFRSSSNGTTSHPSTKNPASSFRATSNARAKCWICRSSDHIPRNCPDSTNGFITKGSDGKFWFTPTNQQICFGFNGIYGCSKLECKFLHGCSLSGSGEHSIQSHSL